jgi:shikimate kinase
MRGPVFLVGMMGSGKTTVGRCLAALTGAAFCDLDQRLGRITGRTVAELFVDGEPSFRALERAALRSLVAEPGFASRPCVVATGGGVVIDPDNRATMQRAGTIVHLEVPIDELVRRLGASASARPLLQSGAPRDVLADLLDARRDAYADGAVAIDGTGDADTVAARIAAHLGIAPTERV